MIIFNTQLLDLQSYEFKDLEPLSRNKPKVFSGLWSLWYFFFQLFHKEAHLHKTYVEQRYHFQEPPPVRKRQRFMCCCYTLMLLTDVCKKKTDPILQPAVICASSFLPWHFPLFSGPHLALCDHFTACRTRTFCIFPLFW